MKSNFKVGIVGSGSWGLALATVLSKKNKVSLFFNSKESFYEVKKKGYSKYLPGIKIPEDIILDINLSKIELCDVTFIVVPAQRFRENITNLVDKKVTPKNLILCSKGIEKKTNLLMSEISNGFFPKIDTMILSGPNFAREVAEGLPTAYAFSGRNEKKIRKIGQEISSKTFRPYFNTDIVGTQLGGAIKNIIAIACGIVIGNKLGENARSSVLTRGLQELIGLGLKMGAKRETFFGLSGLGDLNLSCGSTNSRNFCFGFKLGQGISINNLKNEKKLIEGVHSCDAVSELAERYKVDMPITLAVKKIVNGNSIKKVINNLLSRPLQFES